MRLPAGARIVLQSHYVNVVDRDLLVADVAVFDFVEEGEAYTEASYFTVNHGGIDLPEGDVTTSVSCEVARRTQLVSLFGHMHDWGTSVKIEREREGTTEVLYEVEEWTVEYRDLPPINTYAVDDPLVLEPGDKVHVTCSYHNDTGENLRFPKEMCVAFGAYFPAEGGFYICDEGSAVMKPAPLAPAFALLAGAFLAACSPPASGDAGLVDASAADAGGDAGASCSPNLPPASDPCLLGQCGNEKGVGQPCTRGGGECSDLGNGNAIFCTADFREDAALAYCTRPCVVDEDCGSDAVCARDPDDPDGPAGCLSASCDTPLADGGAPDASTPQDGGHDAG